MSLKTEREDINAKINSLIEDRESLQSQVQAITQELIALRKSRDSLTQQIHLIIHPTRAQRLEQKLCKNRRYLAAVTMRLVDKLTFKEIGAVLGVGASYAGNLFHKGMRMQYRRYRHIVPANVLGSSENFQEWAEDNMGGKYEIDFS